MSDIRITAQCKTCDKIRCVSEMFFGEDFLDIILECEHSYVVKIDREAPISEKKYGETMSKLTNYEEILFQAADIIRFVACKHPKTDIIRASAIISKLAEELELTTGGFNNNERRGT